MNSHVEITEDEFDQRYTLLENHIDPHASWAYDDQRGCLFGTSAAEMRFALDQDHRCVWTLLEGDQGMWLVSGIHIVNRMGYLISTTPVRRGQTIAVRVEGPGDLEEMEGGQPTLL